MQQSDTLARVFLLTGDCYFAVQPTLVTTVLGSCLAVTLHAKTQGVGAICHAFLPDSSEVKKTVQPEPQICRYVDTALRNMLETMEKIGIPRRDLTIKMFGGSSGVAVQGMEYSLYNIGLRNVTMARKLLGAAGLTIAVEDVGGSQGRKLVFDTQSGEVWVKKLSGLSGRSRNIR